MEADEPKALQSSIKEKYRSDPATALATLCASERLGEGVTCKIDIDKTMIQVGLHPASGGSGLSAY